MQTKSLLELLREEDAAVKELEARIDGAKSLNTLDLDAVEKCTALMRDAAERRRRIKQELTDYIAGIGEQIEMGRIRESKPEKIEPFIQMLMKEARRHGFVENCKDFGISEIEAHKCVDYLQDVFEIALY